MIAEKLRNDPLYFFPEEDHSAQSFFLIFPPFCCIQNPLLITEKKGRACGWIAMNLESGGGSSLASSRGTSAGDS